MKKEFIKNILGNSQKRTYRREIFRQRLAGFMWCLIIISLIACPIYDKYRKSNGLKPVGQTIDSKVIVEAKETKPYCRDAIECIRTIGEELGMDNKDITKMIRIAKCESNYREDAVNVNTNKTIDRGIYQLNSIHKDINNADAFDYIKNIKYAWNMYQRQGDTPWNSSKHCWNK